LVQAFAFARDFWFIRAWCNGSIRVSKTFDLGSNPSARANELWKNWYIEQNLRLK
jgi:hypothetical protein